MRLVVEKNKNLSSKFITNGLGADACLEGHNCSKISYNFHINCGGKEVTINGSRYEDDSHAVGGARFIWNGMMMLEANI